MRAHAGSVYGVTFSPNGRILAAASADGTVQLWDGHSHNLLGQLNAHAGAISSVAFSPDGRILATADIDGTVVLWDVQSRRTLGTPLRSLRSTVLVCVHSGGSSTTPRPTVRCRKYSTPDLVNSIAFTRNGRRLAAASGNTGKVALWDVQSHHRIATLHTGNRGPVNSVAFSPQGHTLAAGSENGTVQLWDARSHALLETLSADPNQVFSVAFSPDGRFLAAAGFTGTIRVWQKGALWRN
jgi:WD40 repeat protein